MIYIFDPELHCISVDKRPPQKHLRSNFDDHHLQIHFSSNHNINIPIGMVQLHSDWCLRVAPSAQLRYIPQMTLLLLVKMQHDILGATLLSKDQTIGKGRNAEVPPHRGSIL